MARPATGHSEAFCGIAEAYPIGLGHHKPCLERMLPQLRAKLESLHGGARRWGPQAGSAGEAAVASRGCGLLRSGVVLLVLLVAVAVCGGCACRDEPVQPEPQACRSRAAGQGAALASTLLFDRHPGAYSASQLNWRSDWPSTASYYSPGQVIFFRERFIDHQGHAFGGRDHFHRRAESVRVGVGYR